MPEPLLCATVTGRTLDELRRARDSATSDLVELRLDSMERPDAAGALDGKKTPVVVTCRPAWEGGRFAGAEEDRRAILEAALDHGAEYIDVEAEADFASRLIHRRSGKGIIVSRHWFDRQPGNLAAEFDRLLAAGAEIVKLAITARCLSDTLSLFDLASRYPGSSHVLIAMGPFGTATRLLASRLRNRWTYAGDGIAPGQIPAERMLRDFRFRRIRPDAALYGITGNPIGHSRSPVMHNAGFAALGLNAAYLPLQALSVGDFVRTARSLGLRGASVTAPFKVGMMSVVDELDPVAARVGAINTIVARNGRWVGANTDVAGFLAPLRGRMTLQGSRATVLGAGGAARAAAVALADEGASVTVSARRAAAAREIADLVRGTVGAFPPPARSWDLLVNATPAGGPSDPVNPIGASALDGELVYDLVYEPAETKLLQDAKRAGCRTIGGLEMLVAQAERQFELWTGQRPPAGLFQAAAAQAYV